jgi:ketosteroid isomerase-like protein
MANVRHVAVVRRALDAFAARDLDAMGRNVTDDVVWITPGKSLIAGEYRGWPDVRRYLERAIELTADSVRVELVDVLVGADHLAVIVDVRGRRNGRTLDQRAVQVFNLRGGRIAYRRIYPFDQDDWDEFWS